MFGALSLEATAKEAFDTLENGHARSSEENLSQYITARIHKDTLCGTSLDGRTYDLIAQRLKEDFLPAYEEFSRKRESIQTRIDERKIGRYIIGAIAGLTLLEAVITRGRSFKPMVLAFSAPLEAALGAAVYGFVQRRDRKAIEREKKQLFAGMASIDRQLESEESYRMTHELLGHDTVDNDAINTLKEYDDPQQFWSDYTRARAIDPTNDIGLEAVNAPRLREFLVPHVEGRYAQSQRADRFKKLFLKANEVFLERYGESYISDHVAATPAVMPHATPSSQVISQNVRRQTQ